MGIVSAPLGTIAGVVAAGLERIPAHNALAIHRAMGRVHTVLLFGPCIFFSVSGFACHVRRAVTYLGSADF